MLILTNNNLPQKALEKLRAFGKVILLETKDQVYDAISNHPDIFCCQAGEDVIVAPNIPEIVKQQFSASKIKFTLGNKKAEGKYPNTAVYNVVVTENHIIGNKNVMDKSLLNLAKDRKLIHVKQSYTRCNLLPLPGERFITSDLGIFKQLKNNNVEVLYVEPNGIVLEGFKNGFFGGCCGVHGNRVFIAGSLSHFPQGDKVKTFLNDLEIIELYDGPLLDVGSILFLIEHR
jgi:hypothetical protein